MRILIVAPSIFPDLTGNAITVERWRRSLTNKGLKIAILHAGGSGSALLRDILPSFRPDVIHAYHAFKAGAPILKHQLNGDAISQPLVVSPGGTDINLDFTEPEKKQCITRVLRMARVIVAQSSMIAQCLRDQLPDVTDRIIHVGKACTWFGEEPYRLRKIARCTPDSVLFFLPAGVRPVKGNLECLLAMERVHAVRPHIRFVAAGPAIDVPYAEKFEREVNRLSSFACWIRSVPAPAMRAAYEESDVVLNASYSEGFSNSLVETIAAGRPFLASDVPGNRQPAICGGDEEQAGCYFDPHNSADFVTKAVQLVDSRDFRELLSEAARIRALTLPSPDEEADGLISAYRLALKRAD